MADAPALPSLLPCPFCGSADINTEGPCHTQFMCNGCGASEYDQPSHAEAIAAWNRRVAAPTTDDKSAAERFAEWLNKGPKLAAAAGCYVGIKVTEAGDLK